MAADRADGADVPSGDSPDDSGADAIPGRATRAETRSRAEHYVSLRQKVAAGQRSAVAEEAVAEEAVAEEQARAENWTETAELSRWMWTEYRLKGRDRIKEKVSGTMKDFDRSPEEALSLVRDTIRYTFQYTEAHYTQGVRADVTRLQERGLELDKLKNSWSGDQYKGINSQWIDSASGQRFELQFHTRISFEATQLTHSAYERLRAGQPDKFEQMVLEAFQKKVTAEVPVHPGAVGIPEYPEREKYAR